ncbi:DUF411 domain-containing protein [Egbenema bharatensis]|uniref:DUF411 domain-containing protein n=1 Tax=Egbenema bharatensis TaxID=3463334 RepID=UPI003A84A220
MKDWIKRLAIGLITLGAVLMLVVSPSVAEASNMTVYRDPSCNCCGGWIDHLVEEGFQPTEISTADVETVKQQHHVPENFTSCHTAIVQGYVIEGHVPAADIKRLLAERPEVAGIAVPGMPVGTPGMEDGDRRDSFTVFSFDQAGNTAMVNQYSF